jgi:hypothetical protein
LYLVQIDRVRKGPLYQFDKIWQAGFRRVATTSLRGIESVVAGDKCNVQMHGRRYRAARA